MPKHTPVEEQCPEVPALGGNGRDAGGGDIVALAQAEQFQLGTVVGNGKHSIVADVGKRDRHDA